MGRPQPFFNNMTVEVAALDDSSEVRPMVTVSTNASTAVAFSLEETATNAALKATLSLQTLEQDLLVSHIGHIDMSDLTRDLATLITSGLDTINKDIPALPLPVIAGVKLANPAFTTDNREMRFEADFAAADVPSFALV